MPIDPRMISTPLGAAVGLALTHKMLPEERRTPLAYGVGGTAGAGAGFLAGSYMKANPSLSVKDKGRSLKNMGSYYAGNPDQLTQPVGTSERNVIRSMGFNIPQVEKDGISSDTAKLLQNVEPTLAELGVWKARKYFAERQGNSSAAQIIDKRIGELQSQVQSPGFFAGLPKGEDRWMRNMMSSFSEEDFRTGLTRPQKYSQPGYGSQGVGFLGSVAGGVGGWKGGVALGVKAGSKRGLPGATVGGLAGGLAGTKFGGDTLQWLMSKTRGEGRKANPEMISAFGDSEGK